MTDEERDDLIRQTLDRQVKMQTTLDAILAKIDGIATDVKPTVEMLINHPMIKMLGGKKR